MKFNEFIIILSILTLLSVALLSSVSGEDSSLVTKGDKNCNVLGGKLTCQANAHENIKQPIDILPTSSARSFAGKRVSQYKNSHGYVPRYNQPLRYNHRRPIHGYPQKTYINHRRFRRHNDVIDSSIRDSEFDEDVENDYNRKKKSCQKGYILRSGKCVRRLIDCPPGFYLIRWRNKYICHPILV